MSLFLQKKNQLLKHRWAYIYIPIHIHKRTYTYAYVIIHPILYFTHTLRKRAYNVYIPY